MHFDDVASNICQLSPRLKCRSTQEARIRNACRCGRPCLQVCLDMDVDEPEHPAVAAQIKIESTF